jgi:hypothetical protein
MEGIDSGVITWQCGGIATDLMMVFLNWVFRDLTTRISKERGVYIISS